MTLFNFLKPKSIRSVLEYQLYEAEHSRADYQANAEHCTALVTMYQERIDRLRSELDLLSFRDSQPDLKQDSRSFFEIVPN